MSELFSSFAAINCNNEEIHVEEESMNSEGSTGKWLGVRKS